MLENIDERSELGVVSPLLTYEEAGRYLRKGAGFVRAEVYAGRLAIVRIGRTPYIARNELHSYIARRRETGAAAQRPRRQRGAA
jgi:excisionase family DNA binding protein